MVVNMFILSLFFFGPILSLLKSDSFMCHNNIFKAVKFFFSPYDPHYFIINEPWL